MSRPPVIGLYGLPGSGKSTLLSTFRATLGSQSHDWHEGSGMIASLVPGGLDAFKQMPGYQKKQWREKAMLEIDKLARNLSKTAVVAGHHTFWGEEQPIRDEVFTQTDADIYTHIIYLGIAPEIIYQQRQADPRPREAASVDHLAHWQRYEIDSLRQRCLQNDILFTVIYDERDVFEQVKSLILDFERQYNQPNIITVDARIKEIVPDKADLDLVVLFDADKTIAQQDAGRMFWEELAQRDPSITSPLSDIFDGLDKYSEFRFRQAALAYQESCTDQVFEDVCQAVANSISLYPEFRDLLRHINTDKSRKAIVVTSGLRRVWDLVLQRQNLGETVQVIGGGRTSDRIVVTADTKGDIVDFLKNGLNLRVWAFGDSPLDIPMLKKADQAVVVVGDLWTRNRDMESALIMTVTDQSFQPRQVVIPDDTPARLTLPEGTRMPLVHLSDERFRRALSDPMAYEARFDEQVIFDATESPAAKQLSTTMRNADVQGINLRKAHQEAGRWLARTNLPKVIPLESIRIPHVQGNDTNGQAMEYEGKTSIVALMRGGEPMAFGVNDVMPSAMFVHASRPADLDLHHVQGQRTVILVDSVINTGGSIMEFIHRVRQLHSTIRIVVVAGVVHSATINEGSALMDCLRYSGTKVVMLRRSDNTFKGKKGTDTGNRLFNTTHIL